MEKRNLRKDMAIFISRKCKYTDKYFGWNDEMDKYEGTIQVIKSFGERNIGNYYITCYDTETYTWSIKDIELLPKCPKPKSIHFDVKDLHL